MKSQRGRGGVVSNVVYRNIDMKSIDGQCVQVAAVGLGSMLTCSDTTIVRRRLTPLSCSAGHSQLSPGSKTDKQIGHADI